MHDSFTALGGMIPLINMQLGEVVFGGVGSGLYGMIVFVIVAIFVAGLMVGRTPEYLGKKIEAREVKMAMLAILCLPLVMLGGTAVALGVPSAVAAMNNAGPHGFSEILYAFTSSGGQQRIGLRRPHGQHDVLQRAAGLRHADRALPASSSRCWRSPARWPPRRPCRPRRARSRPPVALFVGLLVGVILIVGGLTFFPALALGPIVEHFATVAKQTF